MRPLLACAAVLGNNRAVPPRQTQLWEHGPEPLDACAVSLCKLYVAVQSQRSQSVGHGPGSVLSALHAYEFSYFS